MNMHMKAPCKGFCAASFQSCIILFKRGIIHFIIQNTPNWAKRDLFGGNDEVHEADDEVRSGANDEAVHTTQLSRITKPPLAHI